MKIICVGRNYVEHAAELTNEVPTTPLLFMKPDTAILSQGRAFYHPDFSSNIHHEIELVLKIKKSGKHISEKFAREYYEEIGLGIDFTARDVQDQLKKSSHPWEIAKAFDHSAVIGEFIPKSQLNYPDQSIAFSLLKNGILCQKGATDDMIFGFDVLISYISKYFTLHQGDLIYTGTPAGVSKVEIGDKYEGYIGDQKMLICEIK